MFHLVTLSGAGEILVYGRGQFRLPRTARSHVAYLIRRIRCQKLERDRKVDILKGWPAFALSSHLLATS